MKFLTPKISGLLLLIVCLFLLSINVRADFTNELLLANNAYVKKNYEEALLHFDEALKIDSNNFVILMGKAESLANLNRLKQSEEVYNKALLCSSNNAINLSLVYLSLGWIHAQMTNFNQAIAEYGKAIQFHPSSEEPYLGRADSLTRKGMYDEAMQDCDMAILLNPNASRAYEFRGVIFGKIGKTDKCIADYTKAIELDPKDGWHYQSRALEFFKKDDYTNAIADFEKAAEITPELSQDAFFMSSRGFCRSKLGAFENGIEDCKKAVHLDTNNVMALNNLAWLLAIAPDIKLRDGKKAVEYAKRANEITESKDPYILGTLAAAYAESGDFGEAVKWEKKSIIAKLPEKEISLAHEMLSLFEQAKPYHAKAK